VRSYKFGLALTCVSLCIAACGNSEPKPATSAGSGGSGGSSSGAGAAAIAGTSGSAVMAPPSVSCGTQMCAAIPLATGFVAPCCADAAKGVCGAEGSAGSGMMGCRPLNQPGVLDPNCPASTGAMLNGFPLPTFPGCCRESTGLCGFDVDNLGGVLPFAPGCIDPATVIPGTVAQACGPGVSPAGGSGGSGT
jgi:hypothetical protein